MHDWTLGFVDLPAQLQLKNKPSRWLWDSDRKYNCAAPSKHPRAALLTAYRPLVGYAVAMSYSTKYLEGN
jgi:hypothetical protein